MSGTSSRKYSQKRVWTSSAVLKKKKDVFSAKLYIIIKYSNQQICDCFCWIVCSSDWYSGDRSSFTVQREGGWCDNRQKKALRMVGPGFGQIRSHGQRLFSVRNLNTLYFRTRFNALTTTEKQSDFCCCGFFFSGLLWQSWTFWTLCLRSK